MLQPSQLLSGPWLRWSLPTLLVALAASLGLSPGVVAPQPDPPETIDYGRDVRPILSDRCYACHGPDTGTRKAGLRLDTRDGATALLPSGRRAIVPGDPSASALLHRAGHPSANDRMPPPDTGKSVTEAEIAILERWIDQGAPWAAHWSLVPPNRPTVPAGLREHPVDAFVERPLAALELHLASEASREALIRRVTLDLIGLPPSLAEIDAFLEDARPDAYERVVDRLLASPHYGEHRARFWMDAARYGDTHGLHLDQVRSLWPWRDWVIQAFNSNMPFDRFTVEQLAGDLLPDATQDQRVASGFNRCNVTTGEGGLIAEEYLVKYAIDRVETTSTVWLGLTVGCAQCHDHKYDPITQREFYGLYAFFNSIAEEASDKNALAPPPVMKAPRPEDEARLAAVDAKLVAARARQHAPDPAMDAAQEAWETSWKDAGAGRWTELLPTSALSRGGATVAIGEDNTVVVSGHSPGREIYEVVATTDVSTISAVRLETLVGENGGVGRASHHNIVLSSFELLASPKDRPLAAKSVPLSRASADYSQRAYPIAASLDGKSGTGWAMDAGQSPRTAIFELEQPLETTGGAVLRFRLGHESDHPRHTLGRFRLSVTRDPTVSPTRLGAWRSRGPFKAKSAKVALTKDFGPETEAAGTAADDDEPPWVERPEYVDGQIHHLGPHDNAATYLERTLIAPSPRPMTLALGSDDAIKVWLNGERVLERDVRRPVAADQEKVTVQLREGENRLLLKIVNAGGGYAFYFRVVGEHPEGIPTALARSLAKPVGDRTDDERTAVRGWFRRHHSPAWKALEDEVTALEAERRQADALVPVTMVMAERMDRRAAHVLERGQYDRKGEEVAAGVPAALPPLPEGTVDRLSLARWLVNPDHPLTARVTVNRLWQSLFGRGLVVTSEDFGAQGAWPSHPELLDWLACEFVESGWDVKHMIRLLVTSHVYKQSAHVTTNSLRLDPDNRRLSRGSRHRLDAEVIRDQALAASGLLVPRIGGPSVKPYQPAGIWKAVGYTSSNTAIFKQDHGEALYRRSLYTFWKRTAPPPTLQILDAPTREACRVRRARTNTPLQALALMNDVQYVEAARNLATRALREAGSNDEALAEFVFRTATGRHPNERERAVLRRVLKQQIQAFRADPEKARNLIGVGESPVPEGVDPVVLGAWTVIANLALNLDEALTRS